VSSSKKQPNPFEIKIEPIKIPKIIINPDLLELIAERKRKNK